MKFQTHYNNRPTDEIRFSKKTTQPSLTIPDQSMSVADLLRRNAKGLSLGGNRNPDYDDDGTGTEIDFDDYIPNTGKMDLADRQEFMEVAKDHLEEVKKKLNALASAREKQRKLREQEDAEIRVERLARKQAATQSGQSTQQQQKPGE